MPPDLLLLSRVSLRGREVAGARLQGLLALLAADLRTGCGTGRLVEGLWPDEQPENPPKALQILVSRVRSQFGADLIVRTATGYRLALTEDQVDAAAVVMRAAAATRCARAGDHAAALSHADAALSLWDGAASVGEGPVAALRAECRSAYVTLVRTRSLALARLDRVAEAAERLAELAAEHPHDEEVLVELLRCEAATVGPAAALARYDAYRRALRDDLGTDPGPAVQDEHRRLLQGAVPAVRRGIAYEPNPLLGREGDVSAVEALLRRFRVVSVVGPGGLGKTRLAHAVARRADLPMVTVVPLAGIAADDDVVREVAAALDVGGRRSPGGVAEIAAALATGPALLVLDNCEQVVAGVADLAGALVAMTADVRILTTSRTPLGLSSESVHHLPELSLPMSVDLFISRARAARPGIDLPPAAVEEVCRHLDGLPLAVELAAARVRVMSVGELARRLDDRFGLLRGGSRDTPKRHHTLHAVVDWSWNLLEPAGQKAMRALSVFPDGFTADAARYLVDEPEHVIERLVDHSLIKVLDTPAGTRFRMLETVREFSAERRVAAGENERVTTGFLAWARAFGLARHDSVFGTDPFDAVAETRAEQENLLQALRTAVRRDDLPTVAAAAAVLSGLWGLESNFARITALMRETAWPLSHYRPEPAFVEVTRTALSLAVTFGFSHQGTRPGRASVALRRLGLAAPDTFIRAGGYTIGVLTKPEELLRLCDSAEPLVAGAANMLACYHFETVRDIDSALKAARRGLEIAADHGLVWFTAMSHSRVAELYMQAERGADARDHLTVSLPVLERLGAWVDAFGARAWLVLANLQIGDTDEAERWLDGLPRHTLGDQDANSLGYDLALRAEVLFARGEIDAGLRLWRRVLDLVRAGATTPGIPVDLDPYLVEVRAAAVVAHARHGRLDLVADTADALPARLTHLLTHPLASPPPYLVEQAVYGTLLLAIGMAELAREPRSAARMIALAERFRFLRNFQPTMSGAAARADAERADRPAYDGAVSSYAGLDGPGLRAAALELLDHRVRSRL